MERRFVLFYFIFSCRRGARPFRVKLFFCFFVEVDCECYGRQEEHEKRPKMAIHRTTY